MSSAIPIRVLVVDDHTLFRRGLIALLAQDSRFSVTGEAADLGEALRCLPHAQPDVILLDNHMPGVRGIDGIATLKDTAQGVRVMMLTVSESEDDLIGALRAGADGYLLKTTDADQLTDSIVKVLVGESVVSPEMTSKLITALRLAPAAVSVTASLAAPAGGTPSVTAAPVAGVVLEGTPLLKDLSGRELGILRLIARGDSNKLIARELDIAETTVKIHVQHILRKLKVTSRVQAAVYAVNHGIQ